MRTPFGAARRRRRACKEGHRGLSNAAREGSECFAAAFREVTPHARPRRSGGIGDDGYIRGGLMRTASHFIGRFGKLPGYWAPAQLFSSGAQTWRAL